MLRFLTAGESHGQALVVIVEGLPAGLAISVEDIQAELARRRLGFGRGPRQRFEVDELTLLGGVRHGRTLGSPVAIEIKNTEWFRSDKWHAEMSPAAGATAAPLTQVRPGHADLAGMQKYGFTDARDVLERASARETAARVAAGALAKCLLAELGVCVLSHVVQLGTVRAAGARPTPKDLSTVDESPVRCFDHTVAEAMVAEVKAAAKEGDSLGGVVEVLAYGVPVGLGSHVHWDRKLDARMAQAVMSIQAVKGVELGDGFEVAGRRGSAAHDPIRWDADAGTYRRDTTLAGGVEGGMSTGELVVVRAAMKPLATLNVPVLETVDTATKESTLSFKERTDVTAVPAMGVVAETMVALVLAMEAQRKFGGDSVRELVRNAEGFRGQLAGMTRPSRHLVLVGLMGSGKTTVATFVARRLGQRLLDTDELVEAGAGRSIREIWLNGGEPAFRELEFQALRGALATAEPAVLAAGGGVVLREDNRAALRAADALVVWLDADNEVLLERAAKADHRPLLDDDSAAAMKRMRDERERWYREVADARIDTTARSHEDVVTELLALVTESRGRPRYSVTKAGWRRVTVPLGTRAYDVVIGHGAAAELCRLLPPGARRAAIVSQASIPFSVDPGLPVERFDIGVGEAHKTLATVEQLALRFAGMGLSRGDVVVAVGGGMVTDVAGFAAATWHRGVSVVHVPTTLLGMVDAAIGGKTGVNLAAGKNLVGAFWQPVAVICDLDALSTLPERERRSGDGEMAKYHFLTGDDLEAMELTDRVTHCIRIKADFVATDERERLGGGRRALLNYGHTLAHALETATGHDLTHGEAVGVGLVYAAELARALGRIDGARVADHRRVVGESYGLPVSIPDGLAPDELITLMRRDKKAVDGLTFVLDGPNGLEVVSDVAEPVVRAALDAVVRA